MDRARELVLECAQEIAESASGAVFHVPASTGGGRYYVVSLSREACECSDFEHRGGSCKHLLAAEIVKTACACCADCGQRSLRRDLVEVMPEHESLLWYEGDRLCRRCALACGVL